MDTKNIKKNKPTVDIAVVAYNEENTIEHVLRSILAQKRDLYELKGITVYADACTDKTVEIVHIMTKISPIIRVLENKKRRGKVRQLDHIFKNVQSDLLLLLDSDIGIQGFDFINAFVEASKRDKHSVMFAAHQVLIQPDNFVGRLYYASFLLWDYIRLANPDRDHVQNLYASAILFRYDFVHTLTIPKEVKQMRSYLYLKAKKDGGFGYVENAVMTYWPPHSTKDFFALRKRVFGREQATLEKIFGDIAKGIHHIDKKYKWAGIVRFTKEYHLYVFPALFLNYVLSILSKYNKAEHTSIWDVVTTSKKKITSGKIIISSYDDLKNRTYAGGGAVAVHEVAKHLAKDFDVTVITGTYLGARNENIDGVVYKRVGTSVFGAKFGQLIFHLVLPFYVVGEKYDVWIESFTPPFSTSFLPLFTSKPVIGLVHLLSAEEMTKKYHLPFKYIEDLGLKRYKNFIVLTEESEKKIRRINPNSNIEIIGNGVSFPEYSKYIRDGEIEQLSYIGRIEIEQKGLDLLIAAYKKIADKINIPLCIAGSGSNSDVLKLKQLILENGLEKMVHLLGRIEGVEKERFFQKNSIGIMSSRYETYSLVALEFMACGIPTVVFDIPGVMWIPHDAVVKSKAFDVDDLAKNILSLVENKSLRSNIAKRGRLEAHGKDWESVSMKYQSFIWSVMQHK